MTDNDNWQDPKLHPVPAFALTEGMNSWPRWADDDDDDATPLVVASCDNCECDIYDGDPAVSVNGNVVCDMCAFYLRAASTTPQEQKL